MLARRGFLAFLGFGAGAAAAAKVASLLPAAPPVTGRGIQIMYGQMSVDRLFEGNVGIYNGIIIREVEHIPYGTASNLLSSQREINLRRSAQLRFADCAKYETAVERERKRFRKFMDGDQWSPSQIEEIRRG